MQQVLSEVNEVLFGEADPSSSDTPPSQHTYTLETPTREWKAPMEFKPQPAPFNITIPKANFGMCLRGNREDYYNPSNSFLPDVLGSRRGLPITLCLIHMSVCRRLGIPVDMLNMPMHVISQAGPYRGSLTLLVDAPPISADTDTTLDSIIEANLQPLPSTAHHENKPRESPSSTTGQELSRNSQADASARFIKSTTLTQQVEEARQEPTMRDDRRQEVARKLVITIEPEPEAFYVDCFQEGNIMGEQELA